MDLLTVQTRVREALHNTGGLALRPSATRDASAAADSSPVAAGKALVAAVSGGADSLCLLHTLYTLAPEKGFRLHVAHFDHGLRPTAVDEAAWVAALCARWGLPAMRSSLGCGRSGSARTMTG